MPSDQHTHELLLVGTPLDDEAPLAPPAIQALESSDLILGESRKRTYRLLSQVPSGKQKAVCLLEKESFWREELSALASRDTGSVALFSDCGMPLLFDPGKEVLQEALRLGFRVRTIPSAT